MLWLQARPSNLSWMSSSLRMLGFSNSNLCLRWSHGVNMVFYQQESDSPQLSTSINLNHMQLHKHTQVTHSAIHLHTYTHTHTDPPTPLTHTHTNTGSATHKGVNNRKWYVAEIVSVQLDSANTTLFSVHVDMSSIFLACLEVFTPSKGYLSHWCLWLYF